MTTVVTVMDRDGFDARTDNIVVVQPNRRRLLWVPRDAWCQGIGNRINLAFKVGGHEALLSGLGNLGIPVEHSLCLRRSSVENALDGVVVTVPVPAPVRLWYPLNPYLRVQDGRKAVDFLPPRETLEGERIHQWIGARHERDPSRRPPDLVRIQRQQVFVRALMRQGFDFASVFRAGAEPSMSSEAALDDLRQVRRWWRFSCADQVDDREIDGKRVLVLRSPEPQPSRSRRRAASLIRRLKPANWKR